MIWSNPLVLHVFSGLLLGTGFMLPPFWWLGLLGVTLQVGLLYNHMARWWHTVAAWVVSYLCALSWFWSTYPLDWLGISSSTGQLIVIGLYWVSAAVWLGLGGLLFYLGFRLVHHLFGRWVLFALPFLWLGAQLAGAFIFSLMTYGPAGTIGTQFSFGFLGYHFVQHAVFIELAQIAGVYGLTVVFVFSGVLLYVLLKLRQYIVIAGLVVLGVTLHIVGVGAQTAEYSTSTATVAVISTEFAPVFQMTSEQLAVKQVELRAAYEAARTAGTDYILFPEDSRFLPQSSGDFALAATVGQSTSSTPLLVIDTARVEQADGVFQQVMLFNAATQVKQIAHKQYLVPQGEYLPTLYRFGLSLFGVDEVLKNKQSQFAYTPGPLSDQSSFSTTTPAVLFCFESVDPYGVRKLVTDRAAVPFVVHPVSHGWFTKPNTLQSQLDAMLRIQAIWNDVYIVSAGNQSSSKTYTATGRTVTPTEIASGDRWSVGVVSVPIPPSN